MNRRYDRMREPLTLFAAVWGTGFFSQVISPFLIGSLITSLGLRPGLAGLVLSVELLVTATTSLLLSGRISRLPKRRIALAGAMLAMAMHISSAVTTDLFALFFIRSIAGIGAGACLAAGMASVATAKDPQRLSASMFIISSVIFITIFPILGYITNTYGMLGAYGFEAFWTLVMLIILRMMPDEKVNVAEDAHGPTELSWALLMMVLAAFLIFETCDIGLWSFSERIAHSVGISTSQTGWMVAISGLLGIGGAAISSHLGFRIGHVLPVAIGLFLFGLCSFTILTAKGVTPYAIGILFYQGLYGFNIPYLYGTVGIMDPRGRLIIMASAAALIGSSIGPFVAGMVSEKIGFEIMGWFSLSGILLVAVMLLGSLALVRRKNMPALANPA